MSVDRHDRVSLELGSRVASGLRNHPDWIGHARRNLDQWTERNADAPGLLRCYDEWRTILNQPMDDICSILTGDDDESRRLRQNSPFVGILSPAEVWEIKRRIHETPST